ncbi:MAG TPA: WGR domain-containing protein, partial [Rhodoferax sp.]|nr:WGR domain-containing protein [Rhodoferax sp.]
MSSNVDVPSSDEQFQRFEFVDEKSSKFWEIRVRDSGVDVRYGKIGTAGQTQTKAFEDATAAQNHVRKLIGEKLKGGYVKSASAMGTEAASESSVNADAPLDVAKKSAKVDKIDAQYRSDLGTLTEFAEQMPELKPWIQDFAQISLPYCVPTMKPQNRTNAQQRWDDLIGGFPYTSKQFPWPIHELTDRPMQPILQINLEQAGELLDEHFGDGLLQVWGMAPAKNPLLLRVIPKSAQLDKPDDFFPDGADWEMPESLRLSGDQPLGEEDLFEPRKCMMDFDKSIVVKPRAIWKRAGRMFQIDGKFMSDPEVSTINGDDVFDLLNTVMESVTHPYCGNYLGGFGGAAGGDSDPHFVDPKTGKLLARVSDENGRHVGILVTRDADGKACFTA